MASSKKPRPATKKVRHSREGGNPAALTSLGSCLRRNDELSSKFLSTGQNDLAIFVDAIQRSLSRIADQTSTIPHVAVAYSGGADSTVLLHTVAALHRQSLNAIALHVHHGLSPNADRWLEHCANSAETLGIPFFAERVKLHVTGGQSMEAEARQARYAALHSLCQRHGVQALLTAHHADDQAETVLLNLLRGAGIAGLAGAASQRSFGDLMLLRPFLEIDAMQLRQLAIDQDWPFIEDESNQDKRHTRNALRLEVMPVLKRIFPAVNNRLAQTAAHSAEAQTLLDEIGQDDLAQIRQDSVHPGSRSEGDLDIEGLRKLTRPRAANALRVWFRSQSRHVPSTAALSQMLDQLLESRSDAQISLIHDDLTLQAYRGRIYVRPVIEAPAQPVLIQPLVWNGENEMVLPGWNGKLLFEVNADLDSPGIPVDVLRTGPLSLRTRRGGERIKLHANRPSRSLKNLYQESGIPPWERSTLPLLYVGEQLFFAAGLGMDVRQLRQRNDLVDTDTGLISLSWQSG